jgi:hypothetical protein
MSFTPFLRQPFSSGDVAVLAAFVPAAQQDDEKRTTSLKIDPVARTVVNSQFAYAFTDRLGITDQTFS